MIALVAGVIAASALAGSMHQLSARISTKTGVAPTCTTGAAVAIQLVSARITSSPGPIPSAASPICMAPVQLEVAMAWGTPRCAAKPASSRWI